MFPQKARFVQQQLRNQHIPPHSHCDEMTEESAVAREGHPPVSPASPTLPDTSTASEKRASSSSLSSSQAPLRPTDSSVQSKHSSATASSISKTDLILGVAVVDFNHLQGPIVEWSHPASLSDNNLHGDLTSSLPFCALPDGSHQQDEDFAHFHLHCPTISKHSTVFGISCNRQIASEKLLVKGKDVTRSTVQKAVVVLARQVGGRMETEAA